MTKDTHDNLEYLEYEGPAADAAQMVSIYCLARGYDIQTFMSAMGIIFSHATRAMAGHTFEEGLPSALAALKATIEDPHRKPTPLFGEEALPHAPIAPLPTDKSSFN